MALTAHGEDCLRDVLRYLQDLLRHPLVATHPAAGHVLALNPLCPFRFRAKSARVINYEEFQKALEELAPKRFKDKSKEEAYESICQLVAGREPTNVGVTVSSLFCCLRKQSRPLSKMMGQRPHHRRAESCR